MEIDKLKNRCEIELPYVSIITPSFNQGGFIKETIDSVLNQDYPNIEYWVIDGGSTDETIDILRSYGDRIKWVSEKDNGQADAVNKGIKLAKGSIIGWLNSDDTYMSDAVSSIVSVMTKHSNADVIYGEGYFVDKDSKIIDRYNTEAFSYKRLAEKCLICQPTAFFTKEVVEKVGLLDASLDLCMDYELWMKIAKVSNFIYIPKYLASSRMYLENKTLSRKEEVHKEVCNTIYKHYGYVPLIWLYGYALHNHGRNVFSSILFMLRLNIRYNKNHLFLIFEETLRLIKNKLRCKCGFHGRYDDGWVSKRYKTKLISNEVLKKIEVSGYHVWPIEQSLSIDIKIDGASIKVIELKNIGAFHAEITLGNQLRKGKHLVEMNMSDTYTPSNNKIIKDNRKLSFIFNGITAN